MPSVDSVRCKFRPLRPFPRLATLVAFVHCLEATAQDDVIEVLVSRIGWQTTWLRQAGAQPHCAISKSAARTQLERLSILPSAAGLGIGTQLLKQALLQAKRAGSDELWLSVAAADTAAQAIYASFGFAEKPQASNAERKVMGKSMNE